MNDSMKTTCTVALAAATIALSGCVVSETKTPVDTAAIVAAATPAPAAVPADTPAAPAMSSAPGMDSTLIKQPSAPVSTPASASTPAYTPAPVPAPAAVAPLRVEVDLMARKLHVYENGSVVASHPVAIGSTKWPTQTGAWTIKQVVFNPEWTPPDESWAEEKKPRKPGDPLNPLGRAQLVYDPPRTVHGTNQPASIGQAVSHGSIRMKNADVIAVGKRLMTASGVSKDSAWYRDASQKRKVKQIVDLPAPVPIKVF